jgi:hypothetical protein
MIIDTMLYWERSWTGEWCYFGPNHQPKSYDELKNVVITNQKMFFDPNMIYPSGCFLPQKFQGDKNDCRDTNKLGRI